MRWRDEPWCELVGGPPGWRFVVFDDSKGALFDFAGFAYLPSGPFDGLHTGSFEAPEFRSIGAGWYRWTARW